MRAHKGNNAGEDNFIESSHMHLYPFVEFNTFSISISLSAGSSPVFTLSEKGGGYPIARMSFS